MINNFDYIILLELSSIRLLHVYISTSQSYVPKLFLRCECLNINLASLNEKTHLSYTDTDNVS